MTKETNLLIFVKRILRKYGYPPDLQQMAIDRIIQQSEMIADDWVAGAI
ncbi:MAG: DUF3387 domain-containing protein [Deltaproteobacteria bacterium]|nr:DUF3387 domain-containing protein [Deltaproteobacteria bacterium]